MAEVPAIQGAGGSNVKFFGEGFVGDPTTTIIREETDPATGKKTEVSEVVNHADIPNILKKIQSILDHRVSRSPIKGRLPRGVNAQGDAKLLGTSDDELRALSDKLADVRRGHEWWKNGAPDSLRRLAED